MHLIHSNHDIRRFDDDCHFATGLDAKVIDILIGHGRDKRLSVADIHEDVIGSGPLRYLDDRSFNLITGTDANDSSSCLYDFPLGRVANYGDPITKP